MRDRSERWLRGFFIGGAVIDGAAAIMLVSPSLFGTFFGRAPYAADGDLRVMTGYAAALMVGWTALLAWAAAAPARRAFVGPLTSCVLVGLAATEATALARGDVDPARVVPAVVLQLLAAGAWLALYHAARRSQRDDSGAPTPDSPATTSCSRP